MNFAHFVVIFQAWGFLDARAGVDAPRLSLFDGSADVVGIQAAGDDDLRFEVRDLAPIPGFTGAARDAVAGRIDQQRLDVLRHRLDFQVGRNRSPDAARLAASEAAMKLGDVKPCIENDLGDGPRRFIHEHAHLPDVGRNLRADHGGAGRRDIARAFAIEIESDGGRPGFRQPPVRLHDW